MGYSQKTDNYELPQYLADDRPSYLGDWNEAMSKLDTGMNDNKKDITDVDNKVFNVTQRLQTTEDNMQNVTQTANEAVTVAQNAMGKFPIATSDLRDGVVTAPKLDSSAIQSILSGLRVRVFDSENASADNEGMVIPSNVIKVKGFYMPDIDILVVSRFGCSGEYNLKSVNTDPEIYLPSYIPRPTKPIVIGMDIKSVNGEIVTWTWVSYLPNGAIGVNTPTAGSFNEMTAAGVVSISGVSSGRSITGVQSFIDQNGVI